MFFDTHCHLNDDCYAENPALFVDRAVLASVEYLNVIAYDMLSSERALELAEMFEQVYATIGIHPHDADQCTPENLEALARMVREDHAGSGKIVAIGECGLDYHFPDRLSDEVQRMGFEAQIDLAYRLDLPLVIHARDSVPEAIAILQTKAAAGKLRAVPGVFHCFSGNREEAQEILDLGFYLGFDGPVTYKNGSDTLEMAAWTPDDRIIIETDCPYLSPVPFRGKQNEPSYLPYIAEKIATEKGMGVEAFAQLTTENGKRLFGLK